MRGLAFVTVLLAMTGCGGADSPAAPADAAPRDGAAAIGADARAAFEAAPAAQDTTGFPCDVAAVLRARCQECHGDPLRQGAPMSLLTWAESQSMAPGGTLKTWESMKVMVSTDSMPPPSAGPLTADEKRTLLTWLDAGAPRGTVACSAAALAPPAAAPPAPLP